MPFKIDNAPLKPREPMRGLGDVVAAVAEPAKTFVQQFWSNFFANCNCEAKRKWLNDHFPFSQKR